MIESYLSLQIWENLHVSCDRYIFQFKVTSQTKKSHQKISNTEPTLDGQLLFLQMAIIIPAISQQRIIIQMKI